MSLLPIAESGTPVFATPDAVNELIGTFFRTASIPDDVLELLDMSRKLLATSVIHYEFAAVGAEKSLQALELGVRRHLGVDTRPRFDTLIKKMAASGEFTAEQIDMFDSGRQVRNRVFAHPTGAVAFPLVMMTNIIRTSHVLVALLFSDDPDQTTKET